MIKEVEVKLADQNITISSYMRQSGEKWLLCLHGIQTNRALFLNLLNNPDFNEYSFLCPDFIGFGASQKPKDFSYELPQQLKAIISLLDQLNLKQVSVVGHSLGGMIGTMMLNKVPNRLSALCSIEGNLKIGDCSASKDAHDVSFDQFGSKVYPNLLKSLKESQEPSAGLRLNALSKTPAHVFYKTSKSIVKHSKDGQLFDAFSNTAIPRLLMIGKKGTFTSRPVGNNLQISEIDNAGHFVPLDNPIQFEQTLLDFFS